MIVLAKSFVINNIERVIHVTSALDELLTQHRADNNAYEAMQHGGDVEYVASIIINETTQEQIDKFASFISWHFAFTEAIFSLLHQGIILRTREGTHNVKFRFKSVPPQEPQ